MNYTQLKQKLKEKNIDIKNFRLSYIVPTIRIEKGKEIVEMVDMKLELEKEDYLI